MTQLGPSGGRHAVAVREVDHLLERLGVEDRDRLESRDRCPCRACDRRRTGRSSRSTTGAGPVIPRMPPFASCTARPTCSAPARVPEHGQLPHAVRRRLRVHVAVHPLEVPGVERDVAVPQEEGLVGEAPLVEIGGASHSVPSVPPTRCERGARSRDRSASLAPGPRIGTHAREVDALVVGRRTSGLRVTPPAHLK